MSVLPTESIDQLLAGVVSSPDWALAQRDFNSSKIIFIVGNGGNLAVADHGSIDITRLSEKLSIAPGSGILATSVIGDSSFDDWFTNWLSAHAAVLDESLLGQCMTIGVSSSGTACNICNFLEKGASLGMKTLMLSARKIEERSKLFHTVSIGTDYYHTGEVISLMLFYQLIHGSGSDCPTISGKLGMPVFDRIVNPSS